MAVKQIIPKGFSPGKETSVWFNIIVPGKVDRPFSLRASVWRWVNEPISVGSFEILFPYKNSSVKCES